MTSRPVLPRSHPLAHARLVALDYETGNVSIVANDGRIVVDRINPIQDRGLVTRSTFIPAESRMEIIAGGETIVMTLGTSNQSLPAPVVYLDQNHWIDFARWRKARDSVDSHKAAFYDRLASAVSDGRAVVPLSGAHLTETSKRGGTSRLELAATMLAYSRGWQLRTALGLRRAELRALFGGAPVQRDEAVTLSPEAILDMPPDRSLGQDLGPELAGLVRRQVWACVLVSLLLDEAPDADAGREKATLWAQSFAPLAQSLRTNPRARAWARDLTRTRFISDLGTDLPAAASESGIEPEQFGLWLKEDAEADIQATPGLGRLREVLHLRISNADDRWERNDLNDWMYLSYAAAYCDLVLGERKTIHYLRRAGTKVSPGAVLHMRARDALPDLERLVDAVDTSVDQRG